MSHKSKLQLEKEMLKIVGYPTVIKHKGNTIVYYKTKKIVTDKYNRVIYELFENDSWERKVYNSNGQVIELIRPDYKVVYKYDSQGKNQLVYTEYSDGRWEKRKFDSWGNITYFEKSNGFWLKRTFDTLGNVLYYEDSTGAVRDNRNLSNEVSLNKLAKSLNIKVKELEANIF